jgi:hypothetical protein
VIVTGETFPSFGFTMSFMYLPAGSAGRTPRSA